MADLHAHAQQQCQICLESFSIQQPTELITGLICGPAVMHVFHAHCLTRWQSSGRATCPICMGPLGPQNIYHFGDQNAQPMQGMASILRFFTNLQVSSFTPSKLQRMSYEILWIFTVVALCGGIVYITTGFTVPLLVYSVFLGDAMADVTTSGVQRVTGFSQTVLEIRLSASAIMLCIGCGVWLICGKIIAALFLSSYAAAWISKYQKVPIWIQTRSECVEITTFILMVTSLYRLLYWVVTGIYLYVFAQ